MYVTFRKAKNMKFRDVIFYKKNSSCLTRRTLFIKSFEY